MTLLKDINDKTIVSLIRKGDLSGYEELYDNYAPLLYGIIYHIVKDQIMAEKVLEDTIVKIWKDKSSYESDTLNFFTWIMSIARSMAINTNNQYNKNNTIGSNSALELVLTNGMNINQAADCMKVSVNDALIKFRKELKELLSIRP